jgi:GTPase Era involved in 16S rRNA processing
VKFDKDNADFPTQREPESEPIKEEVNGESSIDQEILSEEPVPDTGEESKDTSDEPIVEETSDDPLPSDDTPNDQSPETSIEELVAEKVTEPVSEEVPAETEGLSSCP